MTRPSLRIVILGLSLSSSWGNGHATTYRALISGLAARGHNVLFLERDVPWYAAHRDLAVAAHGRLAFYTSLAGLEAWRDDIAAADLVVVGSYIPEGDAVGRLVHGVATGVTAFYDIDTPVTFAAVSAGTCAYLTRETAAGYDVYLSFTGGPMLERIEAELGARRARAFYCAVDPDRYRPARAASPRFDLSYLGTFAADRQPALDELLLEPARRAPHLAFAVAGAQYPETIAWPANVTRLDHVPPAEHPAFYGESRFTLNVTRADMVRAGWSPSVRLFEAAACETAIISDHWPGLACVLEPGREVATAAHAADVLAILEDWSPEQVRLMAERARRRILADHTSERRAAEFEEIVAEVRIEALPRRLLRQRSKPDGLAVKPAARPAARSAS